MTTALQAVDDDYELVTHLKGLFHQARQARRDYHDNWQRNYRLVHNRQATQSSASWVPKPRDSEIYPALATNVAWMADQNTQIEYGPAANPNSEYFTFVQSLTADLSTVVETNWYLLNYTSQVKLILWDGMIYGAGFAKTIWDQSLDDGKGNATFKRIDPWALYIDPNATTFDDAEYIIEARQMTFDEIERRWPEGAKHISENNLGGDGEIDERPNRRNSPSPSLHNLGNMSSTQTGATRWGTPKSNNLTMFPRNNVVVYEFWVKENDDWEDTDAEADASETHVEAKWRVVIVAANTILMDEYADDLWPGGGHPYDRWVYDDIGELYGISLVDHLASPQIYINRLLTAMQQNAELCGNPIYVEPKNSGTERTAIINRPGNRLQVNPTATPPQWLTPPSISSDVMPLIQFYINRIENIAGMTAPIKGSMITGADRTPEGVIDSIKEAAFVRIRSGLQNLEATLRSVGAKLANLIIDNYTEPRYVSIVGQSGVQSSKFFEANHFKLGSGKQQALKYSVRVDAGAAASTSRASRMAQADMGLAMGAIDDQAWLEAHNFPNWQQVNERVSKQKAMGTMQPPGARQRAGRTH